jgi:hypothetical protein
MMLWATLSLTPLEAVFWFCALAGTAVFVLRVVLMVVGVSEMDGTDSFDSTHVGHAHHGSHSDALFEIISINSVTAFFMMFGWIGLTCYAQFSLGATPSIMIALLVGILCMYITTYLFRWARKFTSPGGTFNIKNTVGQNAKVYQRIPADGRGRITIDMPDSMTHEIDAIAEDGKEIDSFKSVKVVRVVDQSTVSVRTVS